MAKHNNILLVIGAFLVLDVIVTIAGAIMLDVPKLYHLTTSAHPTQGRVISKEPDNHMAVRYEYLVNGEKYTSRGRAEDINMTFNDVQVGLALPVYYDPSNPSFATIGDPSRYLYSNLRGTVFIFIGLCVCFVLFVIKRTVRR